MRGTYLKLDDKTGLSRFDDTDLVFVDGNYVYADYVASAEGRMRLVPTHPWGPPERCYYTTVTDHPGVVINRYGAGRAIYVPWEPGALYYRQGYTNTLDYCPICSKAAELEPLGGNLPPWLRPPSLSDGTAPTSSCTWSTGRGISASAFSRPSSCPT